MPAILALIAGAVARFLSSSVLRFAAYKILAIGIFTTVLPVVLNKVIFSMMERALNWSNSFTDSVDSVTVQLVGMGAWLGSLLQIPQATSIVLSCVALRYTLKLLRIL